MGRRGEDLGGVRVAASFCARTTRTISARREMLRLRVSCLLGRFTKRGSGEDIVREFCANKSISVFKVLRKERSAVFERILGIASASA